jgi:CHRD domain-containing protein
MAAIPLLVIPIGAQDRDDDEREGPPRHFRASLRARNEVPLVLSDARGRLDLTVNEADTSIHFVLNYSGLQANILFAHIHVGQQGANGGVAVFFCGGPATGPTRPPCPQQGPVEGDITSNDVLVLANGQQLVGGDLGRLLRAIRAGQTYANIHTSASTGGEIRGQIVAVERRD